MTAMIIAEQVRISHRKVEKSWGVGWPERTEKSSLDGTISMGRRMHEVR